jgi:hypothetical protein
MPTTPTLTRLTQPVDFSSAHGDLVYVYKSDEYIATPTDYPNFKYIIDIYTDSATTFVGTLKAYPNPVTKFGVFNIGNIIRNYVNSNLNTNGLDLNNADLANYSVTVQVQAGYEYGTTVTQYHNIEAIDGRYFNHYNGRMFGNYTILNSYMSNYASNRPDKTSVLFNEPLYFSFLSGGGQPIDGTPMSIQVQKYDSNYTFLGANSFTIPYYSYQLKILNISPYAINTKLGSPFLTTSTFAYKIRIIAKDEEGFPSNAYSPFFVINCEPKYTPHTLVFLNKLGGYDSFTFAKVSKKSYDIEKKEYSQLPYTISSATGEMSYYNGIALNDNQITYYGTFKEKLIVNTDIINEDTYKWLGELVTSPQIYICDNAYNFYLVPVMIKQSNFEFKTRINDKAFNLQLELEYGDMQNVQYR